MTKICISILLLLSLISCQNEGAQKSNKLIKNSKGEIYIAILETYKWREATPTFLTINEVETINRILPKAVEQMNLDLKKMFKDSPSEWPNLLVNLNDYKRQYLPYIIKKTGEKRVYINCFCRVRDDGWETQEVGVDGGGKCYFYGTINLDTEKFHGFMINAPL